MKMHLQSSAYYRAVVISRSTGLFVTHDLKSDDPELAMDWARCLAQFCRVELWHRDHLVGSFPPMRHMVDKRR
jgi:hypothetical protein